MYFYNCPLVSSIDCPVFDHQKFLASVRYVCFSLKFMEWCILLMSTVSFQMNLFLIKWTNIMKQISVHQIHQGSWQNVNAWFLLMKDSKSLLQLPFLFPPLSNCKSMSLGTCINVRIISSPYASDKILPNWRILLLPLIKIAPRYPWCSISVPYFIYHTLPSDYIISIYLCFVFCFSLC